MKRAAFVLVALVIATTATTAAGASPAHAQLGGLGKIKKLGDKAVDTKQKVDDLTFTEAEEREIGQQVSQKLRERFGVYQDEAVTKYVSLVGGVLAQGSSKPGLQWQFIVLDTEGVNAYAAPGGFVHVTKGLLGLMKSEAELAGVLGHEITHISQRHTVNAIRNDKSIGLGADAAGSGGGLRQQLIAKAVGKAFQDVFDGKWSRGDENESDKTGIQLANKAGYSASGLGDALQKVADRNASQSEPNGWFVSHPVIKDRIANIARQITSEKLAATAVVDARYKQFITFDAKPITEVTEDVDGAAGLAAGDKKKDEKDTNDAKDTKENGKKRSFGLGAITGNKQSASSQQTASAGARGATPDRDAKGGPNKNALGVKITAAELEAFRKGIAS